MTRPTTARRPDCSATGLMDATTGKYYTPPVTFC
jgi:hypothetical protein